MYYMEILENCDMNICYKHKGLNLTKVTNLYITACEQYPYDHQGAPPHFPYKNRSPICKTSCNIKLLMLNTITPTIN